MASEVNGIYIIIDKDGHPIGASTDYGKAWEEVLKREKEFGENVRLMSVPNIQ